MISKLGNIPVAAASFYMYLKRSKSQYRPATIRQIQNNRLKQMIKYCYENIKYYRETFDAAGIKSSDIQSAEDVHKLPILEKQQLRERFWDFLPAKLGWCRVSRTSGSTGVPLCILTDINSKINNSAAVIRQRKAAGLGYFGGDIISLCKAPGQKALKSHWTFLQGLHRVHYVNPYEFSDESQFVIRKCRKPVVIGITPAVEAMAYGIADGKMQKFDVRAVITTGQKLDAKVKEVISENLDCEVFDIYACNEAGDIAWQCGHCQGHHVNAENVIVEILDKNNEPAKNGESGKVVITNLCRFSMPIIRYANGDWAKKSDDINCKCGCKLPMLGEIKGRTGENIYLPSGKIIPWHVVKGAMSCPQIRQFRITQQSNSSLMIEYASEPNCQAEAIEKLVIQRLDKILARKLSVKFSKVNQIDVAVSGKYRLVHCHYNPNEKSR